MHALCQSFFVATVLGQTQTIRNKINVFQRKMIRRINIAYWSNVMKNDECDQILPLRQSLGLNLQFTNKHLKQNL